MEPRYLENMHCLKFSHKMLRGWIIVGSQMGKGKFQDVTLYWVIMVFMRNIYKPRSVK